MFYESELLKYHTDLVDDILAECNRGLSIEEIAILYETQISREKRKRQLMSDNMIRQIQEKMNNPNFIKTDTRDFNFYRF